MMHQAQPSDVWLTRDLRNILQALALTADDAAPGEYSRGYRAAIAAVAVAIGVSVPPHVPDKAPFRT